MMVINRKEAKYINYTFREYAKNYDLTDEMAEVLIHIKKYKNKSLPLTDEMVNTIQDVLGFEVILLEQIDIDEFTDEIEYKSLFNKYRKHKGLE